MKLTYAESSKCLCGARLAYKQGEDAWDCSDILLGKAIPSGEPGSVEHEARLPFVFWKVKPEPIDYRMFAGPDIHIVKRLFNKVVHLGDR